MTVSKVEVVVLGLLADEPLHGYDLLERFRSRSMGFWVEVGKASVYQTLRRLERDGSIAGSRRKAPTGPIAACIASRAKAGNDSARSRGARSALAPYETEAGVALGFAHLVPAGEARRAVDERARSVRDLLDAVKTELDRTQTDEGSGRAVSTAMLHQQRRSPRPNSRGSSPTGRRSRKAGGKGIGGGVRDSTYDGCEWKRRSSIWTRRSSRGRRRSPCPGPCIARAWFRAASSFAVRTPSSSTSWSGRTSRRWSG